MPLIVGLDWGASGQAVCALDEHGIILVQFECPHSAAGLAGLLRRLRQVAAPEALPVAIECPSGLVFETLAAAGYPIVPIHPNVVKACRPRYRASGGKSDPGDAYMLADILCTDEHRFQPLTALSGEIEALRAHVRGSDDLVAQRVALTTKGLEALTRRFSDLPVALIFLEATGGFEASGLPRWQPSACRSASSTHARSGTSPEPWAGWRRSTRSTLR